MRNILLKSGIVYSFEMVLFIEPDYINIYVAVCAYFALFH